MHQMESIFLFYVTPHCLYFDLWIPLNKKIKNIFRSFVSWYSVRCSFSGWTESSLRALSIPGIPSYIYIYMTNNRHDIIGHLHYYCEIILYIISLCWQATNLRWNFWSLSHAYLIVIYLLLVYMHSQIMQYSLEIACAVPNFYAICSLPIILLCKLAHMTLKIEHNFQFCWNLFIKQWRWALLFYCIITK